MLTKRIKKENESKGSTATIMFVLACIAGALFFTILAAHNAHISDQNGMIARDWKALYGEKGKEVNVLQNKNKSLKAELAEVKSQLQSLQQLKPQDQASATTPEKKVKVGWDKNSVVDFLKSKKMNSNFRARGDLYLKAGGEGKYLGTATQNVWLLRNLKAKKSGLPATEKRISSSYTVSLRNVSAGEKAKRQEVETLSAKMEMVHFDILGNVKPENKEWNQYEILGTVIPRSFSRAQDFKILGTVKILNQGVGSPESDLKVIGPLVLPSDIHLGNSEVKEVMWSQ